MSTRIGASHEDVFQRTYAIWWGTIVAFFDLSCTFWTSRYDCYHLNSPRHCYSHTHCPWPDFLICVFPERSRQGNLKEGWYRGRCHHLGNDEFTQSYGSRLPTCKIQRSEHKRPLSGTRSTNGIEAVLIYIFLEVNIFATYSLPINVWGNWAVVFSLPFAEVNGESLEQGYNNTVRGKPVYLWENLVRYLAFLGCDLVADLLVLLVLAITFELLPIYFNPCLEFCIL